MFPLSGFSRKSTKFSNFLKIIEKEYFVSFVLDFGYFLGKKPTYQKTLSVAEKALLVIDKI